MSSQSCNKSRKPKKLYSEAYKFQEYGAVLLNHLCPSNSLDTTLSKCRGVAGLFLTAISERFIDQIKKRDGITDLVPFPSRAYDSIASIRKDFEKYRKSVPKKMRANVWSG